MNTLSNDKNKRIGDTRRATKARRKHQIPMSFEFGINLSRTNKDQKEFLFMCFNEAKWLYNYLLDKSNNKSIDLFNIVQKDVKEITHKDKDGNNISVNLNHLGSSMKDAVITSIKNNIKALSKLKCKNFKVGGLKFISDYKSIDLKQYGVTHNINFQTNRIKVQGCKKPFLVHGLDQLTSLPFSYEFANGKLINYNGIYKIRIIIWVDEKKYYEYKEVKEKYTRKLNNIEKVNQLGLDFGCSTTVTTSDGVKYNVDIEESERLKKLQKALDKTKKGSNNRRRIQKQIRREYYRLSCVKQNTANRLSHLLLSSCDELIIQNEQLKSWSENGHGKKVHNSVLGRLKSILTRQPNVHILNEYYPTTKLCTECNHIFRDIELSDRTYVCPCCGHTEDRDVHAAKNMVWIYNHFKIGVDGSEFKRDEFLKQLDEINLVKQSEEGFNMKMLGL